MNIIKNMSFKDYLLSYRFTIASAFKLFLFDYIKTYKNFVDVFIKTFIKKQFPLTVILRDGTKCILKDPHQVRFLTSGHSWKYCKVENDSIIISSDELPPVKFHDWQFGGDLIGIFLSGEYQFLPVKKQTVVDVGGNIGDSAIYFALKGASKVISLEPSPRNYKSAEKNIQSNDLSNKIIMLLAAAGNKTEDIMINPEISGNQGKIELSSIGITIPSYSLTDIVKKFDITSAILKVDCEGCEYDFILSSNKEILRKFSHIQIEYHYGYKNLKEKLEQSGFQIAITNPIRFKKGEFVGYIYATRI